MINLSTSNVVITTRGLRGTNQTCVDGGGNCAVFFAAPNFSDAALLTVVAGTQSTVLDHVIFDGNRSARLAIASSACTSGLGRNVLMYDATNSAVISSGFYRALCGTSFGAALMPTPSQNFTVTANVFAQNGNHSVYWSDGLTIGLIANSNITNNIFSDNSDVSLILGGASGSQISGNTFAQPTQGIYAAFMLTNWTAYPGVTGQWADFRGLSVSQNTFNLGSNADIAIEIGVLPWSTIAISDTRTIGGSFTGNYIYTQKQGINVSGGGSPDYPVFIEGNSLVSAGAQLYGGLVATETSLMNVQDPGGDSFVSGADTFNATNINWTAAF